MSILPTSPTNRMLTCLLALACGSSVACVIGEGTGILPEDIGDGGTGTGDDEAGEDVGGTEDEEGTTGSDTGTDDDSGTESSGETTDGTTGTTEGDTTEEGTSDDSTGGSPCEGIEDMVLDVAYQIFLDGSSLDMGSCGGSEPENIFEFTAPAAGDFAFTVSNNDFAPILYLRSDCEGNELACEATQALEVSLEADETVFVYVDSNDDGGVTGELTVSQL